VYTIAVQRDFIAQHYLIGGDWGAENELHSHHYRLELQLEGAALDEHGYLASSKANLQVAPRPDRLYPDQLSRWAIERHLGSGIRSTPGAYR
jgi:hypothetical protein